MHRRHRACLHVLQIAGILAVASLASAQTTNSTQQAASVLVAPFDTDRTGWMPPPRLGETLAELLTARLVSEHGLRAIDRAWLPESPDSVLERAAQRGVDYVVLGAVTRLSIERHSTSRAAFLPVPAGAGLVRRQKTATALGLSVRVVDVRTGEVVATAVSEGDGSQQQTSGGGLVLVGKLPLVGGSRSSATGVQDRLLDHAVQQAIDAAAQEIAQSLR